MKTVYGLLPVLTGSGKNTGRFTPARIEITPETEALIIQARQDLGSRIRHGLQGPKGFEIGIENSVALLSAPEGFHVPTDVSVRVVPNFGLYTGESLTLPPRKVSRITTTEITVSSKRPQGPHVVVGDKMFRSLREGSIGFTSHFLRMSLEANPDIDLSLIPDRHKVDLGISFFTMDQHHEAEWVKYLETHDVRRLRPDLPHEGEALATLRKLLGERKLTALGLADAAIRVNSALREVRTSKETEVAGRGRKEAV